ncbi:MAG TPA: enoyl-CoA hydratase-related protein, partial [bacterium]|nr:enoyl-CoA hydratase-related protein [bacterium]
DRPPAPRKMDPRTQEDMMTFTRIRLDIADAIATITIDRPDARNAIDRETIREIREALERTRGDEACRVLIVTGAGDKVFVSGADVRTLLARTTKDVLAAGNNLLFREIEELPIPTIAAVNGFALGGGLELALACDIRVASENAKMGLPETGLGILPGAGGTQRLPRIVGMGIAKEMILAGTILDAQAALRVGLVNRVVPAAELMNAAREVAQAIAKRAPVATRLAKMSLHAAANGPAQIGMDFEIVAQAVLNSTADMKEGMNAFLEKRPAGFQGE